MANAVARAYSEVLGRQWGSSTKPLLSQSAGEVSYNWSSWLRAIFIFCCLRMELQKHTISYTFWHAHNNKSVNAWNIS